MHKPVSSQLKISMVFIDEGEDVDGINGVVRCSKNIRCP